MQTFLNYYNVADITSTENAGFLLGQEVEAKF